MFAGLAEVSPESVEAAWRVSGLDDQGWQLRLCSNLAVHPLHGWAV
jgi:hypothetical protein